MNARKPSFQFSGENLPVVVLNNRTQYAVGQGYFHAGELFANHAPKFRYVVDCGAMSKYAKQRDSRIDAYLAAVGAKQPLDLLFISHAHADHLNGVQRLLDKTKGLKVKTIVLPLMNVEDRLIAFAHTVSVDPTSAASPFYREFVVDPVTALGRFGPARVILVKSGGPRNGAPFGRRPNDLEVPPDDFAAPRRDNQGEVPWRFFGRGRIDQDPSLTAKLNGGDAYIAPDSLGIVCKDAGTTPDWLLAPYIDKAIKAKSLLFMQTLAKGRGKSVGALRAWLRRTSNIQLLLTTYVSELKAAYEATSADLNLTSMCLYSGPIPSTKLRHRQYRGAFGLFAFSDSDAPTCAAWLGTGDADLATKKRRDAFLKHYGSLLEEVLTMTLPHHGSERNFHSDLLTRIEPLFCVASADTFGKWRHPGTSVIQSIASTGRFLSVVTSSTLSEVSETLLLV